MTLIKLNANINIIKIDYQFPSNIIPIQKGEPMPISTIPEWMTNLEDEDITFIKKFLQASGSLKEIAHQYGVTYPTVRLRLDRLIQKIQISEDITSDPYIALVKRLAVNDRLDFDTAKILIAEYKKIGGRQ